MKENLERFVAAVNEAYSSGKVKPAKGNFCKCVKNECFACAIGAAYFEKYGISQGAYGMLLWVQREFSLEANEVEGIMLGFDSLPNSPPLQISSAFAKAYEAGQALAKRWIV